MRLRDKGIATAFATVGVGEVLPEIERMRDAADQLRRNPQWADELSAPESIFLLGQADVATMFETSNFKRVFELRYPQAQSRAAVVNWVFSVPYDVDPDPKITSRGDRLRFILHLRLRRSVYAFRNIEERIVQKVLGLLRGHAENIRIHVGLGWSDLVVDAHFSPRMLHKLAASIVQIHGLRMRYRTKAGPADFPVLQRMLTVLGYVGEPPHFPDRGHVTFLRGKPGQYLALEELLRGYGAVFMLDGKADFMVVSKPKEKDWLARQRELGDGRYDDRLRKVETHLMKVPAGRLREAAGSPDLVIETDETFDREVCECRTIGETKLASLDSLMSDLHGHRNLLPTEQRYAIDNTLFLLSASLRDASICCDARDAVLASHDGLTKILRALDAVDREFADALPTERHAHVVALWRRLDEWHRFTELLLRQRTVGSFEELLGQSDRSVVYSGGVQKFLYLADQLIADFAKKLAPENPPRFATIYDSVKTPFSFRMGVVRVPTSKIFSFPLVVPDLWHEVAGTLFFLRYGRQINERALPGQQNAFLENLADHYADMMVYLHGFGADFERFLVSLAHGWTRAYGDMSSALGRSSIGQFLIRAYLILELHHVRGLQQSGGKDPASDFYIDLQRTTTRILEDLRSRLLPSHKALQPLAELATEADWQLLHKNVTTVDFSDYHRQLYAPLVDVRASAPGADLSRFAEGEVVALTDDDDLNALFGELAYRVATGRDTARHFRTMAALGRSAEIEYHRRQLSTRTVSAGKTRRQAAQMARPRDPEKTPVMTGDRVVTYKPPRLGPKSRVKQYVVVKRCGTGGMAEVFHVFDEQAKRDVALKFPLTAAGPEAERVLQTELAVGRTVSHGNLCAVYEFGRYRNRPFIAMQYVVDDLSKIIHRETYIDKPRGIALARDIFDGLAALHREEIVHRDMKPSNVLVDKDGRAKISDFGLAILREGTPYARAGTPSYMAPEQAAGAPATYASDVYSAGLILYEMFTGEKLAAGRGAAHAPPPSSVRRSLKNLDALIVACLDPDPANRPSAEDALENWQKLARRKR
ncbi:MAG TPA: serine/threonine-protein kinase [Thermoanaerobaculia bacterium]|nr:serine/threonine-protein kinase [Thermoanaerobaculia bacterium]